MKSAREEVREPSINCLKMLPGRYPVPHLRSPKTFQHPTLQIGVTCVGLLLCDG